MSCPLAVHKAMLVQDLASDKSSTSIKPLMFLLLTLGSFIFLKLGKYRACRPVVCSRANKGPALYFCLLFFLPSPVLIEHFIMILFVFILAYKLYLFLVIALEFAKYTYNTTNINLLSKNDIMLHG